MPCTPLVSVIVPVYNGARYLDEALASILAQSHHPSQIIVINDGSTDETAQRALAYGDLILYAEHPHQGLCAALNQGLCLAEGEYLSFLDADDLWTENKLARQLDEFASNPHLDLCFGHVKQFREASDGTRTDLPDVNEGYFKGTLLVRRETFSRVGFFDESLRYGDFLDWYMRAQEKGLTVNMLPDILLLRRIHEDNMGVRERSSRTDYLRVLKQSLDRRQNQVP